MDNQREKFDTEGKYNKPDNAGRKGSSFQIDLLVYFLLKALNRGGKWCLSTENEEAGKFDDVVFESEEGDILLQAKHKQNAMSEITLDDLWSPNANKSGFYLPMYFQSYQQIKGKFYISNVILCTTAKFDTKSNRKYVKNISLRQCPMLNHDDSEAQCVTFNETFTTELKHKIEKYMHVTKQRKSKIHTRDVSEFVSRFQLIVNFPSEMKLWTVIKGQISQQVMASGLDVEACFTSIQKKVDDGFCKIEHKKGIYLTRSSAKCFFSEIRSNLYCHSLKSYEISFEKQYLIPVTTDIREKTVLHVVPSQCSLELYQAECLLSSIKVLQDVDLTKTLFLKLNENANVIQHTVEGFESTRVTCIVIIIDSNQTMNTTLIEQLLNTLNRHDEKKIILVGEESNSFTAHIKELKKGNKFIYKMIHDKIVFTQLTEETQKRVRVTKCISFQGRDVSLDDLHLTNEELDEIVRADLLVKLGKNERIEVGYQLLDIDAHYIPRNLMRFTCMEPDHAIYDYAVKHQEKIVLISNDAGMGKSTTLSKIALSIKDGHPDLLVYRINLNMIMHYLSGCSEASILDMLESQDATKPKTPFEKQLFSLCERVALMVDAVDEISPNYTKIIIDLLIKCKMQCNFSVIFVTTRPHMCPYLANKLNTEAFSLKPISPLNQAELLYCILCCRLELQDDNQKRRCKQYVEALLNMISQWMDDLHTTFTEVPLQVSMFAEVFMENTRGSEDWDGCKEFVNSNVTKPKLPKRFDLPDLYRMFIDKKRYIFVYEKGKVDGKILAEEGIICIFDSCYASHGFLALKSVLPKEICEHFRYYKENENKTLDIKNILKIGIVQEIGNNFYFIHSTFAEYFIAEVLLIEMNRQQDQIFLESLVFDILSFPTYKMVRTFLDDLLKKDLDNMASMISKNDGYIDFMRRLNERNDQSNSALEIAAQEGHSNILTLLLKCFDINLNKCGNISGTALHSAASGGHLSIVKLLVKANADVYVENGHRLKPYHLAAMKGHLEVVKYFLEEVGIVADCTAVHLSAAEGHLAIVQYLVGKGITKNIPCRLPLHKITFTNQSIVKYLLDCLVEVHIINNIKLTLLHKAARAGCLDAVRYLVEKGATINLRDALGNTALHYASESGYLEVVKILVNKGETLRGETPSERILNINSQNNKGATPLYKATGATYPDVFRFLVENGARIIIPDKNGCIAIHYAAEYGNLGVMKFLINTSTSDCYPCEGEHISKWDLDVNAEDKNKSTPLHKASKASHLDVVEFLLEKGASIEYRDKEGRTALHYAVQQTNFKLVKSRGQKIPVEIPCDGQLQVIEHLLDCGAIVNVTDQEDKTPLHEAVRLGCLEVCHLLVQRGADANLPDATGFTSLHVAVMSNNLEMVKFLVNKCNVNVNAESNNRIAPHSAVLRTKNSSLKIAQFLAEKGADTKAKNNRGFTPIELCELVQEVKRCSR